MRIRRPSPGTVISTIALVFAMTGGAVAGGAAVEFARNAGAVDGKSAVDAGSSSNRARGNLVATARGGSNPAQIPNKFLADAPESRPLALLLPVEDNQTGGAVDLAQSPFGRFTLACQDQAAAAGTEDPRMMLAFTNSSGGGVNIARRAGVGEATVAQLPNGTVDQFSIANSNTFRVHLQKDGTQVVIEGAARQERPDPANGACGVWATYQAFR
jgi:hypothetical protein